ncbi:NAD(P)H-binding protein [Ideonella paludis]|uniref:NAD(P)H-binding protein n=1 Tax=Ideonella paludis TaxID=1233411 RepID=A0ABS5E1Q2_9BURK|nr:NAD(P)H-binding protein [Ideonella paludis]MBQ0937343.1 NAD(P)H-binding protein [Ideonella paludis]
MTQLLLLGATGLVGQQVLAQALANPAVARVVAPTRRPLAPHPKLLNPIVDFKALPQADWWAADAVVCCLGTTLKLAGSPAAFREVDHDFVLAAARLARAAGTPTFALNSSLGAAASSGNLYLRTKGETEDALAALGFTSLTVVRPSLLDGGPRPDSRPGEALGLWFARVARPLIPARYRAVRTEAVARALLQAALRPAAGQSVVENDAL